jgi:hypothetical protein
VLPLGWLGGLLGQRLGVSLPALPSGLLLEKALLFLLPLLLDLLEKPPVRFLDLLVLDDLLGVKEGVRGLGGGGSYSRCCLGVGWRGWRWHWQLA